MTRKVLIMSNRITPKCRSLHYDNGAFAIAALNLFETYQTQLARRQRQGKEPTYELQLHEVREVKNERAGG